MKKLKTSLIVLMDSVKFEEVLEVEGLKLEGQLYKHVLWFLSK